MIRSVEWTWPILLVGTAMMAFAFLPDKPLWALANAFAAGLSVDPTADWVASKLRSGKPKE